MAYKKNVVWVSARQILTSRRYETSIEVKATFEKQHGTQKQCQSF